jgi:hypothetical protein
VPFCGRKWSSELFSVLLTVSWLLESESSELVLGGDASSLFLRAEELPNIAFRRFHLLFGGGWDSGKSSLLEPAVWSVGAGGTTRSKETKRLGGEMWLSHRIMIIRRPGAGVQGAEDSGALSSFSAFA